MTCCLLLRLLFVEVVDRGAPWVVRPRRSPSHSVEMLVSRLGRRWRTWLVATAVAELVASWLVARTLLHFDAAAVSSAAMVMPGSTTAAVGSLALVLAVLAAGIGWLRSRRCDARQLAYAGFAGYAVAVLPIVRSAAGSSHLILMAQTMLLMVVAPALVVAAQAARDLRRPTAATAGSAAAVYLGVLFLSHLPATHQAAMTDPGWDWIRIAACSAAGLAFWTFARNRVVALVAVGAGSGLLGLALLVGPAPLFVMGSDRLHLAALTDQRLGGLLMMAVDLLVLLPVIGRALETSPRSLAAIIDDSM